jgi:hypothetical protein
LPLRSRQPRYGIPLQPGLAPAATPEGRVNEGAKEVFRRARLAERGKMPIFAVQMAKVCHEHAPDRA